MFETYASIRFVFKSKPGHSENCVHQLSQQSQANASKVLNDILYEIVLQKLMEKTLQ